MDMKQTEKTRVVVIGGGYAGTLAANHLRRRPTSTSPWSIRARCSSNGSGCTIGRRQPHGDHRLRQLLGGAVRLVVDRAERIDAAGRRIALAPVTTLDYDYLIYAVGSTGAVPAGGPGGRRIRLSPRRIGAGATVARRDGRLPPQRRRSWWSAAG